MCYLINIVYGNTKHMICKTIEVNDIPTTLQRGPQGFKGERGLSGEKGEPGVVNYKMVDEKIEEIIEQTTGSLTRRVEKLEEQVLKLQRNASKSLETDAQESICVGVTYGKTCYWTVLHSSRNVNFDEASVICTRKEGKIAFFQDSQHFKQIMKYIRALIPPSQSWVHVWLGMTISPKIASAASILTA
ncbi:uncharacterized protein LOC120346529 [Styela clava]